MIPDTGLEVVDVHVGGLHQVVEAFQPTPHVGQLRLHRLQLDPLLLGNPVHLLVHQLDQFPDVAIGQDVGANLLYHHLLEISGVQPGGVARPAAPLHQRLADVVGELAALGVLAGEGAVAPVALDQPAQQVGTADPAGMGLPGGAGAHLPADLAELGLGDDGGESLLHPHRLRLVLGFCPPYERAGVGLVAQDDVDPVLGPELAGGIGDALVVEGAADVQDALARLGQGEDALHDGRGLRVRLQGGALSGPVLDHQLAEAVGHAAGDPEAPGGGLPHPPRDFLGQDIRHPINTKKSDIHGRLDLMRVDHHYGYRRFKRLAFWCIASDTPNCGLFIGTGPHECDLSIDRGRPCGTGPLAAHTDSNERNRTMRGLGPTDLAFTAGRFMPQETGLPSVYAKSSFNYLLPCSSMCTSKRIGHRIPPRTEVRAFPASSTLSHPLGRRFGILARLLPRVQWGHRLSAVGNQSSLSIEASD